MGNGNTKNRVGQRVGKLVVIRLSHIGKHRRAIWECKCDCGSFTLKSSSDLASKKVKSCGCLIKESVGLPTGEAHMNKLFYTYQRGALKRGLEFSITKEEFRGITSLECFYCGAPPSLSGNYENFNGEYPHNGIDRIDNSIGYVPENVVPCCSTCNYAKREMKYEEFVSWVSKISDHLNAKLILSRTLGK